MVTAKPSATMTAVLSRMSAEDGPLPDATTLPPEQGRAQTARVHARWRSALPPVALAEDFTAPDAEGGAMRCRRIVPSGPFRPGAILFLHGGGWSFCSVDTHEDLMRRLAIASEMVVLSCDYRLAPEHPFPAGLHDCISFWRAAKHRQLPGLTGNGPLVIAGDSAGANLALASMLSELSEGRDTPDAALLLYGAFGVDFDSVSYRAHAEGPGLTRDKMRRFWDWYCRDADRTEFRAVPLLAPTDLLLQLPPLLLAAAEVDPLRSDTEQLAERLSGTGRSDHLHLLPGLVHGALQMGAWLPDARDGIAHVGQMLRMLHDQPADTEPIRPRTDT